MVDTTIIISIVVLALSITAMVLWPRREDDRPRRTSLLRAIGVLGIIALLYASTRADRQAAQEEMQAKVTLANAVAVARANVGDRSGEVQRLASELAEAKTNLEVRTGDLQREIDRTNEEKRQAAAAAAAAEDALRKALEKVAEVNQKSNEFVFRDSLPFTPGSAEINCQGRESLAKLVGYLAYSLGTGAIRVHVAGHTDDRYFGPSARAKLFNQSLSEARANAVRDYLIQNGIPAAIIDAKGLGMSQPVGHLEPQPDEIVRLENDTAEKRARNRRVSVSLDRD